MPDIGTVADSLAAWFKPLVRRAFITFAQTAFGLSLLSIGIAVGGYVIASPPSVLRGVLAVLVAFGCFVAFGVPLMIKRAIGAVVREGIVKLGLGAKVSQVLFKRMSEPGVDTAGEGSAATAAPVPLSQAASQLQRAIETVQRLNNDERLGFFRGKIQAALLALVGKVTNARFREAASKLGTVDVAAVKQQLSGDIDQRIVALVNKTLWRTTAMALLLCCGVPLVFALLMRAL